MFRAVRTTLTWKELEVRGQLILYYDHALQYLFLLLVILNILLSHYLLDRVIF